MYDLIFDNDNSHQWYLLVGGRNCGRTYFLERSRMKYWDYINGCVVDDSSYAPIYNGHEVYIETYEVGENCRINIVYTEEIKKNENMHYFKERVCNQSGIQLSDLGKLIRFCVPDKKYKEIYGDELDVKQEVR